MFVRFQIYSISVHSKHKHRYFLLFHRFLLLHLSSEIHQADAGICFDIAQRLHSYQSYQWNKSLGCSQTRYPNFFTFNLYVGILRFKSRCSLYRRIRRPFLEYRRYCVQALGFWKTESNHTHPICERRREGEARVWDTTCHMTDNRDEM